MSVRTPLAALALLAVAASPARADRASAAAHFERARAAEQRGDFRMAIAEYERAYRASPHPAVRYNLASVLEKVGDLRSAADNFRRYLEEAGDPSDCASVERRIEALRDRPSRLVVELSPRGAAVELDERVLPIGQTELDVAAGDHVVRAVLDGRRSEPREIEAGYGEPLRVSLSAPPADAAAARGPGGLRRSVEYGAASIGLVALVYGGLYGLEARKISQELSAREGAWSASDSRRYAEGEATARRAWIVGGIGAGLLATSALLTYLRRDDGAERAVAIGPSVGAGGVGVSLATGF